MMEYSAHYSNAHKMLFNIERYPHIIWNSRRTLQILYLQDGIVKEVSLMRCQIGLMKRATNTAQGKKPENSSILKNIKVRPLFLSRRRIKDIAESQRVGQRDSPSGPTGQR